MQNSLIRGIVIGLITGMPTGPIGALCLKTTLTYGRRYGMISGLGSAMADSVYATAAALGINFVSKFLIRNQHFIRLFGALILIGFGIHTFFSKSAKDSREVNRTSMLKSFILTFTLALANPGTIFSFIVVFTGTGLYSASKNPINTLLIILGVFIGSELWWILLVSTANIFHHKLTSGNMNKLNKILGSVIAVSGAFVLISLSNYPKMLRPPFIHSKLFEWILHLKSRFPLRKYL